MSFKKVLFADCIWCLSTTDSPVFGCKSTLPVSSMRSFSICSKEWDMIQKMSAHTKRTFELLFLTSSILPPNWPKSGLPSSATRHLLTLERLSKLSKEAVPDNPDISFKRTAISDPCALRSSKIRNPSSFQALGPNLEPEALQHDLQVV